MNGRQWLNPPEWSWNKSGSSPEYVHEWVRPLAETETPELILFGAPLSRSSISVSGASHYPEEFRRMWKGYAAYNLDEDLDLTRLLAADAGDVKMHTTDILLCHRRIEETAAYLAAGYPDAVTCMIGGDHSTTACAVRGVKAAYPDEAIGILQLDTHLDVRDPAELGPANGTPIRQLIDGGTVRGEHIVNLGLHGYFNAKPLVDYAKEHQIRMITLKQARTKGVAASARQALQQLEARTDRIYVTVDMDVLDIAAAPGVPASTPGGMSTEELFCTLLEIGRHPSVRHIDFVCLDPMKDTPEKQTVKSGVYAWLQFISGILLNRE